MSSEKFHRDFSKFLEENYNENMTEEERDKLISVFINQYNASLEFEDFLDSDDVYRLLEQAEYADDEKEALQLVKKVLKLEPDNIEALMMQVQLTAKSPVDLLQKTEKTIIKSENLFNEQGLMAEENIGDFWLIFETRPYMRLLNMYQRLLIDLGMFKKAVEVGEKMLYLCKNDNLGIRYSLMHLYAFLEDLEKAEELHEYYSGNNETQMLLPLSILYFKQGDFRKSKIRLTRLSKENKDTMKFIKEMNDGTFDMDSLDENSFGYRPSTIEEFYICFAENTYLYTQSMVYFVWAYDELNKRKK